MLGGQKRMSGGSKNNVGGSKKNGGGVKMESWGVKGGSCRGGQKKRSWGVKKPSFGGSKKKALGGQKKGGPKKKKNVGAFCSTGPPAALPGTRLRCHRRPSLLVAKPTAWSPEESTASAEEAARRCHRQNQRKTLSKMTL